MENIKQVSPWIEYYEKINTLFGEDPDVNVVMDNDNTILKLYVNGDDKASALMELLPGEIKYGNITLEIEIIPANQPAKTRLDLYKDAFAGNPAFSFAYSGAKGLYQADFIVFRNRVVQYHNDDLYDINGFRSTLYQEIAKEIFEDEDIHFCTDTPKNLGKPLGEWP